MWPDETIARAAELACRLEASAEKPGNVTPRHAFPEMGYADFLASAAAIGAVMGAAGRRKVGETILLAIEATRRVTRANTNLGTVLLLAPLARAAAVVPALSKTPRTAAAPRLAELRRTLRSVLRELDVKDAELAYRAIRLAAPGGMGRVPIQDLSSPPALSFLEVMRLAAGRDAIAREYVTDFEITFETGLPLLEDALAAGLTSAEAAVDLFLELLRRNPDTLVERKFGRVAAEEVMARAADALTAGARGSPERAEQVESLDRWLREPSRRWNPGTTADLVAAVLFVWLLAAPDCCQGQEYAKLKDEVAANANPRLRALHRAGRGRSSRPQGRRWGHACGARYGSGPCRARGLSRARLGVCRAGLTAA